MALALRSFHKWTASSLPPLPLPLPLPRRVAYANRSLATDTDSGSDIKAYNLTLS